MSYRELKGWLHKINSRDKNLSMECFYLMKLIHLIRWKDSDKLPPFNSKDYILEFDRSTAEPTQEDIATASQMSKAKWGMLAKGSKNVPNRRDPKTPN